MFKSFNDIVSTIKSNKKLFYAINLLLILIVISLILKEPTKEKSIDEFNNLVKSDTNDTSDYTSDLEIKLESILIEIKGVNYVKVMIYTKNTPKLIPLYDENLDNESNIEIGSDGFKREMIKENSQKDTLLNKDGSKVFEKYYEYPEITGILVVADYSDNEKIKRDILNAVKTLLNTNLNRIEVVAAEKEREGE